VAIGLGYAYEQALRAVQRNTHPFPAELEEYIIRYSREYNIPQEIILSVIRAESSFRSYVTSPMGAMGLMQMMPSTFDWLQTKMGDEYAHGMLFDPATNIRYGTFYLRYLFDLFGDWNLTFAAYNAGQGRVRNDWMPVPEIFRDGELIIAAIPSEETRNYLIRVNRNIEMYRKLYFP